MPRLAVVGLGNVLMGDDGFGPYLAHLLQAWYEWPEEALVVELGTQGLDLTPWVRGAEALVVASSVHRGAPPGTLHRLDRAQVLDRTLPEREPALRHSPHEPGVRDALLTLELAGGAPRDVWVVGAEPETVELTGGLSPGVRPALPRAVEEVLALAREVGIVPRERRPRPEARPWWELRDP